MGRISGLLSSLVLVKHVVDVLGTPYLQKSNIPSR